MKMVDRSLTQVPAPVVPLRSPATLMKPEKLASLQPSRVSSTRYLINRAARGRWAITCTDFRIDERGRGVANYVIDAEGWRFSFPILSFEPSARQRTGRIIGRAWDMMGALIEGDLTAEDRDELARELPKLYEGRASQRTLTWARSNRSGRLFDLTVNSLAEGRQPPVADLGRTGYFMRNTGIDGNGTFGTKSFLAYGSGHPLRVSLQAQMLTAYMMRVFASDLVAHFARLKGGARASAASPELARYLGVGNGSALGLMFFVNNHPRLINRWITIREEAIAAAKSLPIDRDASALHLLARLLDKAITWRRQDKADYEAFAPSMLVADDLAIARRELGRLIEQVRAGCAEAAPLAGFCASLEGRIHADAYETLLSLMIELVPDTADALCDTLVLDEDLAGRPEMTIARLREILHADYAWAFDLDLASEESRRYVWYKSRTAEEPRRGPRAEVGGAHNLGLDLPRLVVALDRDMAGVGGRQSVARFLAQHPQYRGIVTRVQALANLPYHSPQADIMSEAFVPAHIVRLLNVGIHGIDKARDFLNRNLRGVMFHGAPVPADLAAGTADPHWFYPPEPLS